MFAIHKHIYKGDLKKQGRSRLKWLRLSLFSQTPKLWFGLVKNELVAKKPLCYVTWLKIHI